MIDTPHRQYFAVRDEAGTVFPAVEYWAGVMEGNEPPYNVVPLRRFIKLIGPDEPLKDAGNGVFFGTTSARKFTRA